MLGEMEEFVLIYLESLVFCDLYRGKIMVVELVLWKGDVKCKMAVLDVWLFVVWMVGDLCVSRL